MTHQSLVPPPRPSIPVPLQTLKFLTNPFGLIDEAFRECGEIFSIRLLGMGDWIFVCSPPLVKEMFKAPADVLAAGEINAKTLGHVIGLNATFSLDGTAHRERQRLVQPHLNYSAGLKLVPTMREVTSRVISKWTVGDPFPLLQSLQRIALEIIVQMLLHSCGTKKIEELTDLFERFSIESLRSPVIGIHLLQFDLGRFSKWGRIQIQKRQVTEAFSEVLDEIISDREINVGPDIMIALAKSRLPGGDYLSKDDLLSEMFNLLFAGHETTGNFMTWIMSEILRNASVLDRIRSEISSVVGDGPIEGEHLPALKYLESVISEGMRLHPVGPFAGIRRVKKPFRLDRWQIPEGAAIAQCFPAMARRNDIFAKPDEFTPEHFYGKKLKPFEWNPFGGGTRMCTGKGIAEVEMKVVLATMLQQVDLELSQRSIKAVRNGYFFAPNKGLRVTLVRRR